MLCWSSGFVGIRFATEEAPVLAVLFWRSLVSGALLLPFALRLGPRISARAMAEQALFGFLGMFVYLAGFALAIGKGVPTGLVALIADMMPLAIAALSLAAGASGMSMRLADALLPRLARFGNRVLVPTESGQIRWYAASFALAALVILSLLVLV